MVKIDRIEHIVTIPEGVSAGISEDGVVTVNRSQRKPFPNLREHIH